MSKPKKFFLLNEISPTTTGIYEVITSKGRVIYCLFESFLGNEIWETKNASPLNDEKVIAWRQYS